MTASLAAGQKTGWYFDQGGNRALFARQCRDARVLDAFSYAGGFALQAKRAGAAAVTCVDSSEGALAAAAATADANGLDAELLETVTMLVKDEPLARRYFDHPLSGEWSDHRDCHIRPDLILIYRKPDNATLGAMR